MRVIDAQFSDIFDRDDPVGGVSEAEQGPQCGRLAAATRAGDQEIAPIGDELTHGTSGHHREESRLLETGDIESDHTRKPNGEQSAMRRYGRENRMNTDAVVQAHIDAGTRLVET